SIAVCGWLFAAAFSLCAPAVMAQEGNQAAQSATPAPEAKATKEFTEGDVDRRGQEGIAERSKDGSLRKSQRAGLSWVRLAYGGTLWNESTTSALRCRRNAIMRCRIGNLR